MTSQLGKRLWNFSCPNLFKLIGKNPLLVPIYWRCFSFDRYILICFILVLKFFNIVSYWFYHFTYESCSLTYQFNKKNLEMCNIV